MSPLFVGDPGPGVTFGHSRPSLGETCVAYHCRAEQAVAQIVFRAVTVDVGSISEADTNVVEHCRRSYIFGIKRKGFESCYLKGQVADGVAMR